MCSLMTELILNNILSLPSAYRAHRSQFFLCAKMYITLCLNCMMHFITIAESYIECIFSSHSSLCRCCLLKSLDNKKSEDIIIYMGSTMAHDG